MNNFDQRLHTVATMAAVLLAAAPTRTTPDCIRQAEALFDLTATMEGIIKLKPAPDEIERPATSVEARPARSIKRRLNVDDGVLFKSFLARVVLLYGGDTSERRVKIEAGSPRLSADIPVAWLLDENPWIEV